MAKADCGKCVYFVKWSELDGDMKNRAVSMAFEMGKDPSRVLGWCTKKEIPITYFKGYCKDFKRKQKHRTQFTLTGEVAWVDWK